MKKKIFVLLLIIITCFTLNGCKNNQELKMAENITMIIKEGTLTKTSATVIITDTSDYKNIYGEWIRIDKLANSEWQELDPINDNYGFNDIGYTVDENNNLELIHKWDYIYGELESGEYRLVKYMIPSKAIGSATTSDREYFSVQFKID